MRRLLFAAFLFCQMHSAYAADKVIELKSDKSIYLTPENPVLRAIVYGKPDSSDYQYDIIAKLNGTPTAVTRLSDSVMYSLPKALPIGIYTWAVTLVIQDAPYAISLKDSILFCDAKISEIDDLLLIETNPTLIIELNSQKSRYTAIKDSAASELVRIRKEVYHETSITFEVQ